VGRVEAFDADQDNSAGQVYLFYFTLKIQFLTFGFQDFLLLHI